ncbi:leucine-rich repeat extensin-like protein 3 [Argentina anserina]|uniref:leucine-rich repeat extensin-like protein 3 n=1 Tax=Argentina anserina TaxID=57926 RepID=UPI0021767160|nr:leucine-rich repeat extensin-like protein 3 [Potentilla anserina]
MAPELEKPRITEIHVRMDCNGCVQKIKKALHGISGIYDLYIDFPQQKLTIIGWADPEKIVKAIKRTRKIATICSHIEQPTEPAPPAEQQPPEGGAAAPPDAVNPPPTESPPPAEPTPPPEAAPPAEPPKDPPPPEQQPPPPPPQPLPTPVAAETNLGQQHPVYHHRPREVGEVHTVYHHPPDYDYRYADYPSAYPGYYNRYQSYHNSQGPLPEPTPPPAPAPAPSPSPAPAFVPPPIHAPPVYVTHSYNTYRPSPYVTEYGYVQPPPPQQTYSSRISQNHYYNEDQSYHNYSSNGNGNGNITSIFSDENPNACTIM